MTELRASLEIDQFRDNLSKSRKLQPIFYNVEPSHQREFWALNYYWCYDMIIFKVENIINDTIIYFWGKVNHQWYYMIISFFLKLSTILGGIQYKQNFLLLQTPVFQICLKFLLIKRCFSCEISKSFLIWNDTFEKLNIIFEMIWFFFEILISISILYFKMIW